MLSILWKPGKRFHLYLKLYIIFSSTNVLYIPLNISFIYNTFVPFGLILCKETSNVKILLLNPQNIDSQYLYCSNDTVYRYSLVVVSIDFITSNDIISLKISSNRISSSPIYK